MVSHLFLVWRRQLPHYQQALKRQLTLRPSVHNYLWHHSSEEEAEQAKCESKVCPVMSVFHHLQGIAFEVDGTVEVHFVKGLHWDLAFTMVLCSILLIVEVQIMLHWSTWISSLFILSRRY